MCTYRVFEKPSDQCIFLKKSVIRKTDKVDFAGPVFDTESESLLLYRHPDGNWYNRGRKADFKEIDLPEIESGRYLGLDYGKHRENFALSRPEDGAKNENKYIYYVMADKCGFPYFSDLVAALWHARYVNAETWNCYVQPYTPEYRFAPARPRFLMDAIKEHAPLPEEKPFANPLRRLCLQAGMTLTEFSNYFKIKYRTVQNWAGNISPTPEWALPLFELKLLTDGKI